MTQIDHIDEIYSWFSGGVANQFINQNWCSNRAEFNGQLASYSNIIQGQFGEDCSYLVLSSLGEIGNNSFDHNLGFWQGKPGCLFVRNSKYAIIADQGQGLRSSLAKVVDFSTEKSPAIDIAFNRVISGRAPERRGNGLKFVKRNIARCGLNLIVTSGDESASFGVPKAEIQIQKLVNLGVFSLMSW